MKIATYIPEVEVQLRNFYHSLSEEERRYAAQSWATALSPTLLYIAMQALLPGELRGYSIRFS